MKNEQAVVIESVRQGSIGDSLGLKEKDKIIKANGRKVKDIIDLMFYCNEPGSTLLIKRDDKTFSVKLPDDLLTISSLGLNFRPFKVKTCKNKCIFCFVSQLPKGLRKSLYVKDEDYRLSFLYGNYITLTNLTEEDKKRIIQQRLSPLYISVHCTDKQIRNKILNNPNANDIVKEINLFAKYGIRMHSQIVLCPGYNDKEHLSKTIATLYKFYPYISSIAVVPVGLTVFRKQDITPVNKEDALGALDIIEKFQRRFRKKHGESIVYASDELYIKADKPIPPYKHYDDFPQIENGVGMIAQFLQQSKKVKLKENVTNISSRIFTFSGVSFYPYLLDFIKKLRKQKIDINAIQIENNFFGKTVTVTGLLTGRDVIKAFSDIVKKDDVILIPNVTLKDESDVFLDDITLKDIEDILGVKTLVIESTPQGLVKGIFSLGKK
ncbi:MAG: DUF512 domain-containing protein [Thermodesulfovibrionales bacterium]|nr:DUF512 domain-containing protein [Thermodesulfovibrionales bacterium]